MSPVACTVRRHVRRLVSVLALVLALAPASRVLAGGDEARELFLRYCSRCHGTDGTGRDATAHPSVPPMNFRDCRVASSEPSDEWLVAVREGGGSVGRSHEMPAFGTRLDERQIHAVVRYVRSFCEESGWPAGDLNLPRPMTTEKAFPEDEVVFAPAVSHGGDGTAGVELEVEKRIGRRAMIEASLPAGTVAREDGRQVAGVGDVAFAFKNTLHADRAGTRIVSAGIEMTVPTAAGAADFGHHTPVFEPFVAAGFRLGATAFEASLGLELPAAQPWGGRELGYGFYVGRTLSQRPTAWTVGAELTGENREIAITPQVRKGLTRTGALAAALGVSIPLNARDEQSMRWVGYFIWDYAEPVRARR